MTITNSTFEAFRDEQKKIDLAKELLTEKGMTVLSEEDKKSFINKLKEELEWYRSYGSFINHHFPNVDAEACSYADGDWEEQIYESLYKNDNVNRSFVYINVFIYIQLCLFIVYLCRNYISGIKTNKKNTKWII